MEYEYIACFFDCELDQFDWLEKTLLEYDIGKYAIAFEELNNKGQKKPHFHFFFEGTDNIYNAFSKRVVTKYNLRRKGRGGTIKYGKVKEIRNYDKMLQYTIKEGNFRTNFDKDKLKEAIEKSFSKEEKLKILQEMVIELDRFFSKFNQELNKDTVKTRVIKFMLEKDLRISKATLISNINYYFQFSKNLSIDDKIYFFSNIIT